MITEKTANEIVYKLKELDELKNNKSNLKKRTETYIRAYSSIAGFGFDVKKEIIIKLLNREIEQVNVRLNELNILAAQEVQNA